MIFAVSAIVSLVMIVWMVALMYRAFSVSCNVVGKTAVSVFIISLLVGEILSLVALHYGSQALPDRIPDLSARGGEIVSFLSKGEYASIKNRRSMAIDARAIRPLQEAGHYSKIQGHLVKITGGNNG